MRKTTRLKQLIAAPEILVLPGVHDALGARLAEAAGFAALTAGGYGATATLLGRPDSSQLSLTELADMYSRFCDATALPMLADADTGFGNVTNVARAVRLYEKAGVAGLFIEDQVFPKRCGHMAGKAVVPPVEWLAKIKAALDAREDPDFVIMARTDALAVNGVDDAIARAQLACDAGADLLFVEAPTTAGEMRRICAEVPGPCLANNVETGLSPLLPAAELQAIGYAAVVFPVAATYAVAHALAELFATIRRTGTTAEFLPRLLEFDAFNDLVGLPAQRQREATLQEFAEALVARRDSADSTSHASIARRIAMPLSSIRPWLAIAIVFAVAHDRRGAAAGRHAHLAPGAARAPHDQAARRLRRRREAAHERPGRGPALRLRAARQGGREFPAGRARDDRGGDERQLPVGHDDPRDERDAHSLRDERPRADQALPGLRGAPLPRRQARAARREERRLALHHPRDDRHVGRRSRSSRSTISRASRSAASTR